MELANKKIIFFDGDGTLWCPKATKRREKPWWIYKEKGQSYDYYCKMLMIDPATLPTLKKLKKLGIITVLLSTHPHSPKEARVVIRHRADYFGVSELFDELCPSRDYPESKGEFIEKILKARNIPKTKALMVGDSYRYDYKTARAVGVDALLIESDYLEKDRYGKMVRKRIRNIGDLIK